MHLAGTIGRLLAPAVVLSALLLLPAGTVAANDCPDTDLMPTRANLERVRSATLCLLNRERQTRGLAALSPSTDLRGTAQRYSALMVHEQFFAHVSPTGSTLETRVRRQTRYLRGAHSWALGENIAWGSGRLATSAQTVIAWMHSYGHRRNILKPGFRHIGIGVADGAPRPARGLPSATYTTDFGRRSQQAAGSR